MKAWPDRARCEIQWFLGRARQSRGGLMERLRRRCPRAGQGWPPCHVTWWMVGGARPLRWRSVLVFCSPQRCDFALVWPLHRRTPAQKQHDFALQITLRVARLNKTCRVWCESPPLPVLDRNQGADKCPCSWSFGKLIAFENFSYITTQSSFFAQTTLVDWQTSHKCG